MGVSLSQVDLHIHTTASDGVFTPSEVVRMSADLGLRVIAITDHDTLAGIPEARRAAENLPLEVIPGVEVNSEGEWGDLHFLGYYVSPEAEPLRSRLQDMRAARVTRARKMLTRLQQMGMEVTWEEVRAIAGGDTVGRPHIAQALVNRGYVRSAQEAFRRFIGRQGPAYFPRLKLKPPEVIQTILAAGGVPVIAHPAYSGRAAVSRIPEFVEYGLRGVEVYYPHHSPEEVEMLSDLCRKFDLIATGGSDFHGGGVKHAPAPGVVSVPWECVERLRAARRNPIAARRV